jgi:hypothetical protein
MELPEKDKPSERVGRKATGLSFAPRGIWQQGCQASAVPLVAQASRGYAVVLSRRELVGNGAKVKNKRPVAQTGLAKGSHRPLPTPGKPKAVMQPVRAPLP